ncbi:hypothetical protein [Nannocystis sp.]|uniref:hypothetical protein n=1 Tax=Nannocystis sp. TaxID=1962667 RepID=UPI0025E350CA|nr:hypothetical protein [Nannocystis sp.]MBK7825262.1 carboxypeptidase regulatory-like domain-containing protein [Nannocystis sp.]
MLALRRPALLLSALATLPACGDSGRASDSDPTAATVPITISDPSAASTGVQPTETTDAPTGGTDAATTNPASGTTTDPTITDPTITSADTGSSGGDATTGGPCVNLECQVPVCPNGSTTLKGTVYAPEGTLPLYNVVVYVPNAPLDPIPDSVTCDTCKTGLSGQPITAALSDTKGEFVLENVPAGANIPLVVTIGKWRREVVIPNVTACAENLVDPTLSRLPKNQVEGHIPRIAMVTGGADALECLLRKVGIEDSEFTPENGPGRINMFAGKDGGNKYTANLNGGAVFPGGKTLWDDPFKLKNYDMVIMACEGGTDEGNKSAMARQNIVDYAGIGGRLFLSHWHNIWIEKGAAPFPTAATFDHQADLKDPFTAKLQTDFPKGMALADWLVNVGGSIVFGEIAIKAGQNTIAAINDMVSTRWIYGENPTSVQYFTFNAPIGVAEEQQCGRVVDTDIHVSSGDAPGKAFPNGCTTPQLSPQEKVLIFMLFELSSCLIPDDEPPVIPG